MSARNPADLCVCGQPAGDHDCPGDPCHPAVMAMLEYSLQVRACSACGTEDETVAPGGTALCRWCSDLSALLAPAKERRHRARVRRGILVGALVIAVGIWLIVTLVLCGGGPPYAGDMDEMTPVKAAARAIHESLRSHMPDADFPDWDGLHLRWRIMLLHMARDAIAACDAADGTRQEEIPITEAPQAAPKRQAVPAGRHGLAGRPSAAATP